MKTSRGLTLLEIVVVIAMLAIFTSVVLPLQRGCRTPCRRTQCSSNLRQILTAMYLYSDSPENVGTMPTLSQSRCDAFMQKELASEALNLLYRQYVSDPRIFACPSDPTRPTPAALQTIRAWPTDGTRLPKPMTPAFTSYAYDPGHSTNISSMVALLSDKPGRKGNSDNHGPSRGQNVGFGTSVEFRETVKNPLGEGAMDNNIFTLGDVTSGTGPGVSRDEDSYIRP